jgi:hypothetical protein
MGAVKIADLAPLMSGLEISAIILEYCSPSLFSIHFFQTFIA